MFSPFSLAKCFQTKKDQIKQKNARSRTKAMLRQKKRWHAPNFASVIREGLLMKIKSKTEQNVLFRVFSPNIQIRLDARIAAAKDGSLLATRKRRVDSHLAVVAGAVILAHEDVEERLQTFLQMLGKGELLYRQYRYRYMTEGADVEAPHFCTMNMMNT